MGPEDLRGHHHRLELSVELRIDVRDLLPMVSVPCLAISREDDLVVPSQHGHYLAEHLPDAEFHLLPGGDHLAHLLGGEGMSLVEEFVTGHKSSDIHVDRTLATVLMTDIVGSTEEAARLGDKRWRERLDRHDQISADQVARFGGTIVDQTGDGVFATFGGVIPADHMFDPGANEFQAGVMEISYGPSEIHAMAPDREVGHGGSFPGVSAMLAMFLDSGFTFVALCNDDGAQRAYTKALTLIDQTK